MPLGQRHPGYLLRWPEEHEALAHQVSRGALGAVARRSLGLAGMSRRQHREPYDPSVLVDAVPHASGASGDPTRRCLAVEQPARLDAGVDRHSAYTELLQVVAIEVQPEALQVLHELVAAQTRARAPQ